MKLTVYLKDKQLSKMRNGHPVQLSNSDLHATSGTPVNIMLNTKGEYTKLASNIRNNKGYRFVPEKYEIEGGRLSLKGISRGIKSAVRKEANKLASQGKNTINDLIKQGKQQGKKELIKLGNIVADDVQADTGLDVRNKAKSIRQLKTLGKQAASTTLSGAVAGLSGTLGTALAENPAGGIVASKLADKYISQPLNKKLDKSIEGAGFYIKSIKGGSYNSNRPGGSLFVNPNRIIRTAPEARQNDINKLRQAGYDRQLSNLDKSQFNPLGNQFNTRKTSYSRKKNEITGGSFLGGSFRQN